ncbi:MAG: alpha/beta fold hydrolase [Spirochaetes bacterium]|nr:alpha/beta fold hydrolase [Spirochaetota bacterium]
MIPVEDIRFPNNAGRRLAGRVYRTERPSREGIIFSHGLFSSKDGYKITRLADDIVSAGYSLMTFDFSFCGESGGEISDLSVLQEVEDLSAAVDYFTGTGIESIHLMGSSMGAAVSLLYAARGNPALRSLILIAAPVDIDSMFPEINGEREPASLPEDGMTAIDGISIKNTFFREIAGIDMRAALRAVRVPVLAIHGGMDTVVDPRNTDILEEELSTFIKTVLVEDGDHNLTRDRDIRLIKETILWWLAEECPPAQE